MTTINDPIRDVLPALIKLAVDSQTQAREQGLHQTTPANRWLRQFCTVGISAPATCLGNLSGFFNPATDNLVVLNEPARDWLRELGMERTYTVVEIAESLKEAATNPNRTADPLQERTIVLDSHIVFDRIHPKRLYRWIARNLNDVSQHLIITLN